jgi:transcriptional regulator with XRE-family HTH domain
MAGIGEYIRTLRETKNYSQRKLSYLSGLSNATINRIERNITYPGTETLKKLSTGLGVSYEELLNAAGYLNKENFFPSNLKLIREKNNITYERMAEEIKKTTGNEVPKEVLESMENGKYRKFNPVFIDSIAKYEGISPEFFFRENTPKDLEYAIKNQPYKPNTIFQVHPLSHIDDNELRKWMQDPSNIEYLIFAKKICDMGINPEFILKEFVSKIFKNKE